MILSMNEFKNCMKVVVFDLCFFGWGFGVVKEVIEIDILLCLLLTCVIAINRIKDSAIDFEPCSKLENLDLDVRENTYAMEERFLTDDFSSRYFKSPLIFAVSH